MCNVCDTEQPLDRFEPGARYRGGRIPTCRDCRSRRRLERASERAVTVDRKTCSRCGETKVIGEFHADKRSPDGHSGRCRTCKRATRYVEDTRKVRDRFLRWKYGIGIDEYEQLEAAQGDGCAVCGQRPPEPKVLHVDHRHSDGRIRGLLCSNCNTALGLLREDSEVIERLALYAAR